MTASQSPVSITAQRSLRNEKNECFLKIVTCEYHFKKTGTHNLKQNHHFHKKKKKLYASPTLNHAKNRSHSPSCEHPCLRADLCRRVPSASHMTARDIKKPHIREMGARGGHDTGSKKHNTHYKTLLIKQLEAISVTSTLGSMIIARQTFFASKTCNKYEVLRMYEGVRRMITR